jgi:hypothetical protein
MRSLSPVRGRSPAVADNTLAMVQSAIHKRGLQVQVMVHMVVLLYLQSYVTVSFDYGLFINYIIAKSPLTCGS